LKFTVLTVFPELIEAGASQGVLGQARKKGLLSVESVQLREFSDDAHRSVDDRPYGGGDGMIMMAEVLEKALATVSSPGKVIYLSPQGPTLTDRKLRELSKEANLTLICGRYGGIDQRFINEFVDEELSIGDYVLSGGELAALVVVDGVSRLIPGVLGHAESPQQDSFAHGTLEHPNFTRPRDWKGQGVPEVLLSGNHGKIEAWKLSVSRLVTLQKRPDLLNSLSSADWRNLKAFWKTLTPFELESCGLSGLSESSFQI
jgi:tRNA (guanine37-N1)-methyltransferase